MERHNEQIKSQSDLIDVDKPDNHWAQQHDCSTNPNRLACFEY